VPSANSVMRRPDHGRYVAVGPRGHCEHRHDWARIATLTGHGSVAREQGEGVARHGRVPRTSIVAPCAGL
jgi:hypothetical protein